LHLYLPPHSFHPPGVLKGLIYGRVMKFRIQNSKFADFKNCCDQLLLQLLDRGHSRETLQQLFDEAVERLDTESRHKDTNQIFLKLPYKPGTDRSEMRKLFCFDNLVEELNGIGITKATLCYKRPRNLKDLISSTGRNSNPRQTDRLNIVKA